jgi:hypothetical protein
MKKTITNKQNKKTINHRLTDNKESKVILYKGKKYNHLIIFDTSIGHYKVIQNLLNHFTLTDNNCIAGFLIDNYLELQAGQRTIDRLQIAKNGINYKIK